MTKGELLHNIYEFQKALKEFTEAEKAEQPTPEIVPAEPLREMPEDGQQLYFCDTKTGDIQPWNFFVGENLSLIQAGLAFPYTPEGKAGAEQRAKQGFVPYPIAPAKALTEPLKEGDKFWLAHPNAEVLLYYFTYYVKGKKWLSEGRCFPYTTAGKLGAALYQEGQNNE